jgi:PncC family amidohydrolase
MSTSDLARRLSVALDGRTLAVAESVTGGLLTHCLVAAEGSGDWLRGGLVAYDPEVKYSILGVERGPLINERTARTMATGVAHLLNAHVGLATTGVAGPEPLEGNPAGTIWVGVAMDGSVMVERLQCSGTPDEVCERAVERAVRILLAALTPTPAPSP